MKINEIITRIPHAENHINKELAIRANMEEYILFRLHPGFRGKSRMDTPSLQWHQCLLTIVSETKSVISYYGFYKNGVAAKSTFNRGNRRETGPVLFRYTESLFDLLNDHNLRNQVAILHLLRNVEKGPILDQPT